MAADVEEKMVTNMLNTGRMLWMDFCIKSNNPYFTEEEPGHRGKKQLDQGVTSGHSWRLGCEGGWSFPLSTAVLNTLIAAG